jgi:hypothetical protein
MTDFSRRPNVNQAGGACRGRVTTNRGVSDPAYRRKVEFMDRQTLSEESLDGAHELHANGSSNGNGQPSRQGSGQALEVDTGEGSDSGTASMDIGLEPLSPAQLLAVKALRNGCSLWQAAKAAGVSRLTLHEWRVRHPEFSEVMEQWEARALTLACSRVAELAPVAADAMSDALAGENPRAGIALLRSIQVLRAFGATKLQTEGK